MQENILPLVKETVLAYGMSDDELRELLSLSQVKVRDYNKDEIIFHDGDMPECIFLLISGEVHILKDTFSGRQIFISEINEAGDMFGEIYLAIRQPYDVYVQAVKNTRLLTISNELFAMRVEKMSPIAIKIQQTLMRVFARKAFFMHNKIKVLASGSLRERIVRLLFQSMDSEGRVNLRVTRDFMAAYLATTRPSLSRELSAMQKDGIIKLSGRNDIVVTDMERFEEYL